MFFFFFSSRRRHTRWNCDWSSDVCSSDLIEPNPLSVLERMGEVIELLRHTWSILFSSVAGQERVRAEWVVTLLALLELVRLGQARAHQAELFGEIVIEGPTTDAAARHAPEGAEPAAGDTAND